MAIAEQNWTALPVPHTMEFADRVPKQRYFDPDFYQLEAERLWPRVWQMACRLEEIPGPGDFAEYEFLDQSVVVVRTDDLGVRAFQNACRHRGVRWSRAVAPASGASSARSTAGATAPTDQHRVTRAKTFTDHNRQPDDLEPHPGALRDLGRLRLDQPRRWGPAPAPVPRARRHHARRLEGGVPSDRVVVRLPAPGELEAAGGGIRGGLPRHPDPPAAGRPGPLRGAGRGHASTPGASSTPTSATCGP